MTEHVGKQLVDIKIMSINVSCRLDGLLWMSITARFAERKKEPVLYVLTLFYANHRFVGQCVLNAWMLFCPPLTVTNY